MMICSQASAPLLKLYFTPLEAAECVGVAETVIREAIEYGEVRVFDYLRGEPRLSRNALDAWLRKRFNSIRRVPN